MVVIMLLLFIRLQLLFLLRVLHFQLFEILFALLQCRIVNVLRGLIEEIHKVQICNGKQVAGNPVKSHTCGYQIGKIGGESHGEDGNAPAAQEALLLLEHVIPVLRPAQQERRAAGQHRNQRNQRNGPNRRYL